MTELRSTKQRKAVSAWWDGERVMIATTANSRTARNLDATEKARLASGSPDDVVVADVAVLDSVPVAVADETLAAGFQTAVGWNPADVGPGWTFYRLLPVSIQAYRGYDEIPGRQVMRDSRWLD